MAKSDISADQALVNIQKAYELVLSKLNSWLQAGIENLPNFVVAILVLLVFVFLSRWASKLVKKVFETTFHSSQIVGLIASIVRVLVIAIGVFFALQVVGLSGTVTSLLAGAGIVGLAIGFAFQDMTENFIAGIAMGIRKPFETGDVIKTDRVFGTVQTINLRNTIVETFFGQHEIVPNKHLFRNVVTNFHATQKRRIEIAVGIPYAQDIDSAASIIHDAINALDFVIEQEETLVFAYEFANSSINLKVWYWIAYPGDEGYLQARHKGFVAIKQALDNADISIPFPIRTLDFAIEGGSSLSEQMNTVESPDHRDTPSQA